ncbi:hypothetical protein FRC11_007778 [Ceratobasidium sp. 423]|nr:hypothetical protein FRC11_007778 [Ceratobasidium sp. 423]
MFPLGIKNTLARIINRPLPIRAATSPVTDAYNVALDHDWSNTSIDQSGSLTVNLATTIPAPGAPKGPSPYDPYSPDLVTVHQPTRALDHEKDSDLLNDPLRELIQVPPTQIHDSVYRKQLPILIYDHNSDPNRVIPTGVGQNLGRPTQIRSPTPSTKTRPLFLPSRPSTPAQMMNTQAEKRKRDKAPPVCRSEEPVPDKTFKRRRIDPEEPREPDILELSDDEPDSYGMKLTDTGYQSSSLDDTLNELINAYESVKNRLGKAPSVPSAGPSPPQRARPQPPPAQHTREWL